MSFLKRSAKLVFFLLCFRSNGVILLTKVFTIVRIFVLFFLLGKTMFMSICVIGSTSYDITLGKATATAANSQEDIYFNPTIFNLQGTTFSRIYAEIAYRLWLYRCLALQVKRYGNRYSDRTRKFIWPHLHI